LLTAAPVESVAFEAAPWAWLALLLQAASDRAAAAAASIRACFIEASPEQFAER